ncbi:hypothetical protein [Burkholderia sp. 22PA0106]|uniref:hypothetical protein n=1 Tax=Burkholderia sp. 22PA0106 TaxID=3237371 RepID=UPI0039C40E00
MSDDFSERLRLAGLGLRREQALPIERGWALVQPLLERVRQPARDRAAEPAHLFRADARVHDPADSPSETIAP